MKIWRIFTLHLQYVFSHPSKSFLWFLITLVNPLANLAFWIAAIASNKGLGVTVSSMASYYLMLMILGNMLVSHQERDIAIEDIHQGQLSHYLMKPFSYFWLNFIEELPYRIVESFFAIIIFVLFILFLPQLLNLSRDPYMLLGGITISVLALFLSFTFKANLGLTAFWTTDTGGIFNLIDIVMLLFAGYIMPISLYPNLLQKITYALPFPYMLYFPIAAFQGKLTTPEIWNVIGVQVAWLFVLGVGYRILWKRGLVKFTAVGQ